MVLAPHIIVGAAIGNKIHNFWLVAILGIVSHFVMDQIPHWDHHAPDYIISFKKTKRIKYLIKFLILMIVDGIVGLLVVVISLYFKNALNFYLLKFVIVGIFFATLPDILLGFSYIMDKYKISKDYIRFHHFFHSKTQKEGKITFLGLFTQILIIIVALIVFFF